MADPGFLERGGAGLRVAEGHERGGAWGGALGGAVPLPRNFFLNLALEISHFSVF